MKSVAQWAETLKEEFCREVGQPVGLAAGGESPGQAAVALLLEASGERLLLTAEAKQLSSLFVAASLIEESGATQEVVASLWTEILSAIGVRLGGSLRPVHTVAGQQPEPFSLSLGNVTVALGLLPEPSLREASVEGAQASAPGLHGNYDLLLEVELDAMIRFGAREMEIGDLLELGAGDVVELDRQITDPVDLIVGDKIIARGEVVLVNGNFGLRVTDVAEPMRRLESIRCAF